MSLKSVAIALLLLVLPSDVRAACQIGSFDAATSLFFLDTNDNGTWDGVAGGDASSEVATFAGPGIPIVGDWNGDGVDDTGKVVGSRFYLDSNGNRDWDGNGGGDRNTSFAASFGAGTPLAGDWDGDGDDEIGVHLPGRFLIDANGNGLWDGNTGGDYNGHFPQIGPPLVADWDGDGADQIATSSAYWFYVDDNANFIWDGTIGGDRVARFYVPPPGPGTALAGDWFGIGHDTPGSYGTLRSDFALDGNGNFLWNGRAGGDVEGNLGIFTGNGTPLVCDWDGDGDTDLGKVVGGNRFLLDRNSDRYWNGPFHGDRSTVFDVGAPATPLAGRWVAP